MEGMHHLDCVELQISNKNGTIVITCNWGRKANVKEDAEKPPPDDEIGDGCSDVMDKIGKVVLLGSVIARLYPR